MVVVCGLVAWWGPARREELRIALTTVGWTRQGFDAVWWRIMGALYIVGCIVLTPRVSAHLGEVLLASSQAPSRGWAYALDVWFSLNVALFAGAVLVALGFARLAAATHSAAIYSALAPRNPPLATALLFVGVLVAVRSFGRAASSAWSALGGPVAPLEQLREFARIVKRVVSHRMAQGRLLNLNMAAGVALLILLGLTPFQTWYAWRSDITSGAQSGIEHGDGAVLAGASALVGPLVTALWAWKRLVYLVILASAGWGAVGLLWMVGLIRRMSTGGKDLGGGWYEFSPAPGLGLHLGAVAAIAVIAAFGHLALRRPTDVSVPEKRWALIVTLLIAGLVGTVLGALGRIPEGLPV
jgi:hypothetical protein